MTETEDFTIGVEEEYQIVHPETRELRAASGRILPRAERAPDVEAGEVQPELFLSQIEIGTPICRTLADVRAELVRLRRELIRAAERDGSRIAAAGTHPFSHWENQEITPQARYIGIAQDYQQLAREQLIFGCHVHVGIRDQEMAIQVMNRTRAWLAPILALAANSPFWLGADTGYNSFRTEVWRRWPMAGTPQVFASRAEYDELVRTLVETGSVTDASKIYWDVRPATRFPTLEFRVTDVCLTIDEAVMVAGLSRALAHTCYRDAKHERRMNHARPEILRAAKWRAARYGLDADLIDVEGGRSLPARDVIEKLLAFVRESLEEFGEWKEVAALARQTIERGNGAARQRAILASTGQHEQVVDFIVAETTRGVT